MMKTCPVSLGSSGHYFSKGYGGRPGAESMPESRLDEAVVFKDLFTVGLHMPPHPVLLDSLCKF
jgi:hypothetical protein